MVKTIATVILSTLACVPAPAMKEAKKLPLAEQDGIVVRLLPHKVKTADGYYLIGDEDKHTQESAEKRYSDLKAALDEKFAYMFDLKAELDRAQSTMSAKWDEYYTLHEKYNRELKKIIAAWVTESNYAG